jgi:transcriptional regulator with XRE-family HTH domain
MIGLTQVRNDRGWTKTELARRTGLTPIIIYMLETGRRRGTVITWDKLEATLGVPSQKLRATVKETS